MPIDRTPPQDYSCPTCKKYDNSRMVQCDDCSIWYHFDCVGVTEDVENHDWSCLQCTEAKKAAKSKEQVSHQGNPPTQSQEAAVELQQATRTQKGTTRTTMENLDPNSLFAPGPSNRMIQQNDRKSEGSLPTVQAEIRMKMLEEEKALERKYLQRKYEIMMEAAGGSSALLEHNVVNTDLLGAPVSHSSPINSHLRPSAPPFHPNHDDHADAEVDLIMLNRSQIAARQAIPRDLPTFDGDPEEWPLFVATFESTTRVCGFSQEENIIRLQKCLRGKAKESVRSQLLHAMNVDNVISTLRMLFGRPEIIVHSVIRKIHTLPAPKVDKLGSIVDFAVAVRNMVATVHACNLDEYLYNITLLQELVDRLPPMIKLNWAMYRQGKNQVSLGDFSEWLNSLAEAASTVTIPSLTTFAESKTRRGRKDNGFLNSHHETPLLSGRKQISEDQHATCCICNGTCVSVERCKKFLSFDHSTRWQNMRERKLCRCCLKKHRGFCKSKNECGVSGCTSKHHQLLHNNSSFKPRTPQPQNFEQITATPQPRTTSVAEHNCNIHRSDDTEVLFRYVPVILYGHGVKIETYAFLDDGSSLTLLENDLAVELKLDGVAHPLCLQWTADTCRYEESSQKVSLQISGSRNPGVQYHLPAVHTVKQLKLPPQTLEFSKLVDQYKYLKGLPVDSYTNVRPRILIGINNWRVGHVLDSRERKEYEPVASKTRLGWMVYGVHNSAQHHEMYTAYHSYHICSNSSQIDDDLHNIVKKFFALDSIGITKPDKMICSSEDERAWSMMRAITTLENGH
ncbi:uncharacterized protein LOC129770265 [Toxorhynchites rutilus septentrionalis]|uniref:uncharacterized protein LOC129770265 n=1 Tax=Toxorhynchites rutilus septentrionalis TaxID=329112 RepID=UPI002478EB8D|nr:uncharacterized protein LOC129770265 [Toxorhynchites rutilus septentrionalis]